MAKHQKPICIENMEAKAAIELRDSENVKNTIKSQCEHIEIAFRDVSSSFNEMREKLSQLLCECKSFRRENYDFAEVFHKITSGDFSSMINPYAASEDESESFVAQFSGVIFDVENEIDFGKAIETIHGIVKPERRINLCIKVNKAISESIRSLTSKRDKMIERTSLDGSSANEIEVAKKGAIRLGMAIDVMKARGEVVSNIYVESVKQITDFIDKSKRSFKFIYNNKRA